MRILLTGKNGQLGFELQRSLALLGELIATDRVTCDLADSERVRRCVRELAPDVIVNPAAYTAVDQAESDVDLATAVNATAPRILGEEAARIGALVVHFSTDYVFDGRKAGWYNEVDIPNPQSVYGRSKFAGEQGLRAVWERHLILRTGWLVGTQGRNFAKTMLRLAMEQESLSVVADQWGAPTSAASLADLCAHLVHQWTSEREQGFPYGLYHAVAQGETTRCEYARFVLEAALKSGQPLKVRPEQIDAITTAGYPTPAVRPANNRLDTTKLREMFGLAIPDWRNGVQYILNQLFSKS